MKKSANAIFPDLKLLSPMNRKSYSCTSVCSVIGMMELTWGAKTVASTTYVTLGPYVFAALIYFCINFPASKAIEAVERRMRRGDNQ